jgi:hypothetical protein
MRSLGEHAGYLLFATTNNRHIWGKDVYKTSKKCRKNVEFFFLKMGNNFDKKHQTKRRKRKTTKSVKMSTNSDKIWEGTLINGRQKFRLKHQQNNLLCKHQLCKTSTRHRKTTLIFLEGTLTKLQQNGRQKIERSRQ